MTIFRPLACAALLALCLPGQAQQAPAPKAEQVKTPDPDIAVLRAMKSKLFVLQHRDSFQLMRSLSALGSGANEATMKFNNENGLNTLTVRDFPENLAAIEEAIKRLDVASSIRTNPDTNLHIHVLLASKQPTENSVLPEELVQVVQSLKGTLSYKSYTLAATFVQRWDLSSGRTIRGRGEIEGVNLGFGSPKDPSQLRLEWEASPSFGTEQKLGASSSLQISKFQVVMEERTNSGSFNGLARVETSVNLKVGEHVVVGTSVIKDKGLIVVLTARRVD